MSLNQEVVEAVEMWKSWGKNNNNEIDATIEEPDIDSFTVTQLWDAAVSAMRDQSVPAGDEQAATKVHPTDLTGGVNSTQMWDWYFFWLGVFQNPSHPLSSANLYEDLQQYTCKVISEWMNIKYGVCLLAGTRQGIAGALRNLVQRLGWTKGSSDLSEQDLQFREIFVHATANDRITGFIYVDLVTAVRAATETPIILKAHLAPNVKPTPLPPKKKPNDPPDPTPTPDSGGGMGILFIVLLLLAAAVTFSKK